ncbi:MAG: hypothetical protein ACKERG_01150 [Candidatus Hodgkinia cicadicola]
MWRQAESISESKAWGRQLRLLNSDLVRRLLYWITGWKTNDNRIQIGRWL